MFTVFDREKLQKIRESILTGNGRQKVSNTISLTYESELPEHFFIAVQKDRETGSFVLKQSKHIISLDKADAFLDEILEQETLDVVSGALTNLIEQLKSMDEYKSKSGTSLIIPCLLDIDTYCPICNLLQTLKTISSYDISNIEVENSLADERFEILKTIHLFADRALQFIFKIDNYVIPCLLWNYDDESGKLTGIFTNKDFFERIVSKFTERATEEGISLLDIEQIGFEITGKQKDTYNYEIESVKVYVGDEVSQVIESFKLPSELKNDFYTQSYINPIKAILKKKALENSSKISSDFNPLFDSTIEMIIEKANEYLLMSE
jgi:hypothetical protein